MTRPAAPTFFLLIDVEEVQVSIAITEIGYAVREFIDRDFLVMTIEAELVFFIGIGCVEIRREGRAKYLIVVAPMRLMTRTAVTICHGPMKKLLIRNIGFEFIVAFEA